jgi:O-antigen/teichoic acid export membrane protein
VTKADLTGGQLLARNTLWNLSGQMLPMVVGLLAVPVIVRAMGVARFGVLSLAWVVIGYFSLFDLGIGRALTKLVSDKLAAHEERDISPLVWTSLLLMALLGAIAGLIVGSTSPWIVHKALRIPIDLQHETLVGFYLLAASIPIVTVTSGLRGVLEAQQQFRILNLIRIPMSMFSFGGPLLVLPFSSSLVPVIGVLLIGRLVGLGAHAYACLTNMPVLRHDFQLSKSLIRPIVQLGGWMTVSNIVSPLMTYLDRFVVGSLLSVTALGYYTAPYDMVTRVTVIPGAMAGVLFPAFALSLIQNPDRASLLLNRGLKYIFLSVFPILLCLMTLAPEAMRLWLGADFAKHATPALRWLTAGVFVSCLAQVPFALIQSGGRPDLTAKLHLLELPLYLSVVWWLTRSLGIEGTAIAWTGRVTLDAILLVLFGHFVLPHRLSFLMRLGASVAGGLTLMWIGALLQSVSVKLGFLAGSLCIFGLSAWLVALHPDERTFVHGVRGKIFGLRS